MDTNSSVIILKKLKCQITINLFIFLHKRDNTTALGGLGTIFIQDKENSGLQVANIKLFKKYCKHEGFKKIISRIFI